MKEWLISNGFSHNESIKVLDFKRGITKTMSSEISKKLNNALTNANAKALIEKVDDITLTTIGSNSTNYVAKSGIKLSIPKLETIGNTLNFIQLIRTIKNNSEVTPADVISYIPHPVGLIGMIAKMVVDNQVTEINASIWDTAPDWRFVCDWEEIWRKKQGIPDEPLFMYYTDQNKKCNPYLMPTSFIFKNKQMATAVFGFTPTYIDFDVASKITNQFDRNYFKPIKQVKYEAK